MKKVINPKIFTQVVQALVESTAKTATKYIDEKTVVHATWHRKPCGRNSRETVILTFGAPNYLDRIFIKKCKQEGKSFPVKTIQLRAYPVKKKVAK